MTERSDRVSAAFAAFPRAGFLPAAVRARAGDDAPIGIGAGQTNSQPSTVVAMLRLLDVREGDRVLDVGAGSGWTTALLSHLVGASGSVSGVELEPELVAMARRHLAAAGVDAPVAQADPGALGLPEGAPYDRVLVSAEAAELPQALVDQLADPGRMVVPVAGRMTVVDLDGGRVRVRTSGRYRFVPLR